MTLRNLFSAFTKALLTLIVAAVSVNTQASAQEQELARRVSLGTKVQPVSNEIQEKQGLKSNRGVEVIEVLPGSNAEEIKLQAGDVLQSIAGQEIEDVQKFVARVGSLRAGKPIELKFFRDGKLVTQQAGLKELAREKVDDLDIVYGHVDTNVGKLRTVLTMPRDISKGNTKESAKAPAIMLLSGLGNAFVEHPSADPTGMKSLAYGLARKGFVVLRVEKPGCGDSEGGPSRDVDFQSVVAGYIAALKQLKNHPRVDKASIWLFGASIGGVQAPLVAAAEPVKGIAVFGTMAPSWQEFLTDSTRRQLMNTPMTAAEIETEVAKQAAGWNYIIREKIVPDDLAVKHQDLMDWVDATWAEGLYFSGIHYKFFQQLGKAEIAQSLEKNFPGVVLSLWGENDVVTSESGHQWIASVVNRKSPGKASYEALPNIDHNMREAGSAPGAVADNVAPQVINKLDSWIRSKS